MTIANEEKSVGCLTKADLADAIYETISVDKNKAAQIIEDWIEFDKANAKRRESIR